eukprot:TRINITY_DN5208_c0_g1_i1.p1 TRINITY_DN5208_c0_g1~~TRINITY_DN5208_c0_g1_i1.p1  ORF type:complete len:341 (+),score=69.27 TRINITY_DN5208_c0_g1_i1:151-1173(+)
MGIGPSNEKDISPTKASSSRERTASASASSKGYVDSLHGEKSRPLAIGRKESYDLRDEMNMISSPPHGIQFSSSVTAGDGIKQQEIPTVFSWKHGGKAVYLAGTFNEWQEKIPLRESHGDFSCIQNLPPGVHYYRFIVDGKWQTDPSQPIITDANGEKSNLIDINVPKKEDSLLTQNVSSSPPGSYGQQIPVLMEMPPVSTAANAGSTNPSQDPPLLPPHLLRALLNTTPPSAQDPTLLPLPHHVMLNHLYSLPRKEDKAMILGITQRYKTKFVTTVMYKSLDTNINLMPPYLTASDGISSTPPTSTPPAVPLPLEIIDSRDFLASFESNTAAESDFMEL